MATSATAPATPTADELKAQLKALKEAEKKQREEAKAQRDALKEQQAAAKAEADEKREESKKLRDEKMEEIKSVDAEIAEARTALDALKEKRAALVAELPKGTRGTGADSNGYTAVHFGDDGSVTKLSQPARAILDALCGFKGKGGLNRKAIASKAGELGHSLHHTGRVNNEAPTFVALLNADFVTSHEIPGEDGGRSETTYAATDKGRNAWKAYKAANKDSGK